MYPISSEIPRINTPSLSLAELPIPALGDLSEVTLLAQRLHRGNPAKLTHTYSDICNLDTIEVNLVPEKKGIFLKHVEYQVISKVLDRVFERFPLVGVDSRGSVRSSYFRALRDYALYSRTKLTQEISRF